MNASIELITPEKASQLVSQNSFKNRPISHQHVAILAKSMRNGKFRLNGETIKLDIDGNVIDGQHRLLAIICSNVPQAVCVARNVDPEAFDTIDTGRKRTDGNILSIMGEKNSCTLAAALNIVRIYEAKGPLAFGRTGQVASKGSNTSEPVKETIKRHEEIRESVNFVCARKGSLLFRPQSFVSASHYLFSLVSHEKTDSFFDQLVNLNFPSKNSPTKALSMAYQSTAMTMKMKNDLRYRAALWFKAFNAHCEDRSIISLRYQEDEAFPELPNLS